MQRINRAYGMYFRYRHTRPGHCFQGRYGAKLVSGDDYLLRLTRYIHLNPVKTKRLRGLPVEERRAVLEGYPWSSYRGYAGVVAPEGMVNYRWLKMMNRGSESSNRGAYRAYVEEMLGADDDVLGEALTRSAYALGDARFHEETDAQLKAARVSKADWGDIVWPENPRKPLVAVMGPVLREVGLSAEELRRHGRAVGARKAIVIELLCRCSAENRNDDIGCRLVFTPFGRASR